MLPGIRIRELSIFPDERGFFCEIFRDDWSELKAEDKIVQVNASSSLPGVIRAWHRHARGQVDYFLVLKGSMKICAFDDALGSGNRGQLSEILSTESKPQVVRMPGHYWHGVKALGPEAALLIYFVTKLYNHAEPDEERRPWNDPSIVDPRSGSPYDWNAD